MKTQILQVLMQLFKVTKVYQCADRLPDEPLVVVPYDSIGSYGGTINFLIKCN